MLEKCEQCAKHPECKHYTGEPRDCEYLEEKGVDRDTASANPRAQLTALGSFPDSGRLGMTPHPLENRH